LFFDDEVIYSFLIGYKMVFLSHILSFSHSVALLCSLKKIKSESKIPIFHFNKKSLNHFNLLLSDLRYFCKKNN